MRKTSSSPARILPSDITPQEKFLSRRALLAGATGMAALQTIGPFVRGATAQAPGAAALVYQRNAVYSVADAPNSFKDISTYNNYYEFGTDKADPAENSRNFRTQPWNVSVGGECEVAGTFSLEDILKPHALEERVYRMRCVEAWSMVVPWVGFPLADLVKRFKPTSKAKYIEFHTLLDPKQMPGERGSVLDWPYVEGLRIDEAMNPLALMTVGLYGKALPNQNGAPLRLIVPYANVNPEVDHPRWSQATERHIGGSLFDQRRPTLPFNGYAAQVASLYAGMNLRTYF
jgi:sulfoxide reductase catalytic subunit YedY